MEFLHPRLPRLALVLAALLALCATPGFAAPPTGPAQKAPGNGKELIAVMDLDGVGTTDVEQQAITDRLREMMLKTGRFTLVDRSQMKALLDEQALQQAGCTGQECAVQVGQILGVRKIVTGKVVKLAPTAWQISAMMLNVETAETLRADSVRYQGDILSLLDKQVPILAEELAASTADEAPVAMAASAVALAPGGALDHIVGHWSQGAPLLEGRSAHASVVLGGRAYVIGGVNKNDSPLGSVERFDPQRNVWEPVAPLPVPRSEASAAVLGGRIYAIGGTHRDDLLNRVDVYDPARNSWGSAVALPTSLKGALAAVVGGRLLLVGGIGPGGNALNQVLALRPNGSQWEPLAPMKDARANATGQVAGGKLYVFGGRRTSSGLSALGTAQLVDSAEVYDPAANQWATLPKLPTGIAFSASARVGPTIYLFGGYTGSSAMQTPQDKYWAYSLEQNAWSEVGTIPGPRAGGLAGLLGKAYAGRAEHTSVVLRDRVLLIGGKPDAWRTVSELR
ncbi:MAG TPA: kelch repeat-containing protein [bacterium]|nr:kelch repeat-containing protein [bacterium]